MVHMCVRLKREAVWWPGWGGGCGLGGRARATAGKVTKNLTQNQMEKDL
jgi:hypothetical protein